jgi:hypothetical protein
MMIIILLLSRHSNLTILENTELKHKDLNTNRSLFDIINKEEMVYG